MNSRQILKDTLKGCDREEVAKALGMSLGSLNNQIAGERPYFPKGKTPNFVDRFYNFIDVTFNSTGTMLPLEKMAEDFGYMLIANPAIRVSESPAISKIAEIMREFAAMVDETAKANNDGTIEQWEAEKIRQRWEVMKRVTEEFVLACETGLYHAEHNNK